MTRLSITAEVHRYLARQIRQGDVVIDATLGNGHDALFLADQIGESGHLFGFDIQPEALALTADTLASQHLSGRASLFLHSHAAMMDKLPPSVQGKVRCIVFNLGYLPGGDKSLITTPDTTLKALDQSIALLMPQGLISILAYRGHPGGEEECQSIVRWSNARSRKLFSVNVSNFLPTHRNPPLWITIQKSSPS